MVRQAPVICVMAPPVRLGAWSMAIAIAQTIGTMIETLMNSVVLDTYAQCTSQCAFHDM